MCQPRPFVSAQSQPCLSRPKANPRLRVPRPSAPRSVRTGGPTVSCVSHARVICVCAVKFTLPWNRSVLQVGLVIALLDGGNLTRGRFAVLQGYDVLRHPKVRCDRLPPIPVVTRRWLTVQQGSCVHAGGASRPAHRGSSARDRHHAGYVRAQGRLLCLQPLMILASARRGAVPPCAGQRAQVQQRPGSVRSPSSSCI